MKYFTFEGPLSRPLGPKPNDFPPTLLVIPLDCGDPTSPFITTSVFEIS